MTKFEARRRRAEYRQMIIALGFWNVDTPKGARSHHAHYMTGDVYFARNALGFIKIGCSTQVDKRLRGLRSELIGLIPRGGRFEVYLHHYFEGFRAEGEWFQPEPPLLAFIDRVNRQFPLEQAAA